MSTLRFQEKSRLHMLNFVLWVGRVRKPTSCWSQHITKCVNLEKTTLSYFEPVCNFLSVPVFIITLKAFKKLKVEVQSQISFLWDYAYMNKRWIWQQTNSKRHKYWNAETKGLWKLTVIKNKNCSSLLIYLFFSFNFDDIHLVHMYVINSFDVVFAPRHFSV